MRVHTMVPGVLPRIVPEGGVVVDGHFIPAGVRIHFFLVTRKERPLTCAKNV